MATRVTMARIFGILVGALWASFAYYAISRSADGWAAGHTDLGFWWAVIAGFLSIAAAAAVVGTWIHTRAER